MAPLPSKVALARYFVSLRRVANPVPPRPPGPPFRNVRSWP